MPTLQLFAKIQKLKRYLINHQIKAPEVRLITETGENLGVVKTYNALKRALEAELDLVEVSSGAVPPVCKILNFNKFQYQERLKERQSNKKIVKTETKEFRFGPHIGENDLLNKAKRAEEFIKDKNKVKISVVFKGREKAHPEIGEEKIKKFIAQLGDLIKIENNIEYKNGTMSALIAFKSAASS
ncbi:translation initiation factor IF-3 [candidate division WWE3 bacterium CG09_land_8_20_14_0_10_39_24]|uniref:Translation initiation factor IF-3 n=2 Tax=Katanobacteria TaxID=422282 RepID=A0A2G9XDU6_UNCKA|nr:MAG: translation initiation factor IF-3 [candidate division WWE3 bacterium CG23_combo_of_CG06-09_8_20_14_all_40_14]PIS12680.1 MAG: translation initiation factor IF-3 [candidate division WWE3 bacterium CG09_land_8_20_14_0_10_39_24]PJE50901.1 MAG: translation initiation factor IF-3 [candidate division WWE3 bacterium CG10_big_fil_rev_8_21_14_0_10_39_14]